MVLPATPPSPSVQDAVQAAVDASGGRRAALKWKFGTGTLLLRTDVFAAGKRLVHLRTAHPRAADLLERERWALGLLEGAGLVPRRLSDGVTGVDSPHHVLVLEGGRVLSTRPTADDLSAVGDALGRLHDEADVALRLRAPALGFTSLMAAFQALADDVKLYLARREQDGLPQDLLTLNLSDLMRALRRWVAAAEHHFLPPPSRVLCHGRLEPARVVVGSEGAVLTGLEHAVAGDGALDLAQFCEEAALPEPDILVLLDAYHRARGHVDGLLVARLCAGRLLYRLRRAVTALRELQATADVLDDGVGVHAAALGVLLGDARLRLMDAFNGLVDFTGPARPLSLQEVEAMGALLAVEELHLRGQRPVIGVEGGAYAGKTPLSQELAARLRVPWLGVAAALRAAAWATGRPQHADPRDLADMLERLQVVAEGGKLQLQWDGQDALEAARASVPPVRVPEDVLASEAVRRAMAGLVARATSNGVVVEGRDLSLLLPPGTPRFILWVAPSVREARRQAHQASLPDSDRATTPIAPADETLPAAPAGATIIDGSHLSLPQQVRAVLRLLVPTAAAPSNDGLTGRPVLFS